MTPNLLSPFELDVTDFWSFHKENSTSEMKHSIFPLPYMKLKTQEELKDSAIRSTLSDSEQIVKLIAEVEVSGSPSLDFIRRLQHQEEGVCFGKVRLTDDERFNIALHGPGRKKYIRQGSIEHLAAQRKKTLHYLNPDTDVSDIGDLAFQLSEKDTTDNFHDPNSLAGLGLDYLKIVQSIYREVNINALRKDINKNFILKPTGVYGIFVLLHRGPKLRVALKQSIIWFKIIGFMENISLCDLHTHWAFKKITISPKGNLWESGWISADSHRLSHYIRIYDTTIMSYLSYLNSGFMSL